MEFGLIGRKLPHSLSPLIHSKTGALPYVLTELEPHELEGFFAKRDFKGINVTIPYKKEAFAYCDEVSPLAERIGCVNTVIKRHDGTLYGDNTDYYGLKHLFVSANIDPMGKKALILGSGGSSLTARCVLEDLGAEKIITVSRTGENNYENLHLHSDAAVIVNTTPVGMFPDKTELSPVDISLFPHLQGVVDLIFNPLNTRLVLSARERGISAVGGIGMLVVQGFKAAEHFLGRQYCECDIINAERDVISTVRNTVLIGMPGSGKTTIGKALAKMTDREFFDTDEQIVQKCGMSIPEFFELYGEKAFRDLETEVLCSLANKKGAVIAVGGGAVLRRQNRTYIKQNGIAVFIKRDISSLATDGRPLSKNLEEMYKVRLPIYKAMSDIDLSLCSDDPNENARRLCELIY